MTTYYTYSPFTVGFESVFGRLGQMDKSAQSYPPHNIVKVDEDTYQIEMAVAGIKQEDLDITVKDNDLVISYDKPTQDERDYLHKGISTRKFRKEFTLSEYVYVNKADLQNGILTIELSREVPEEKKPRKIAINGASAKKEFLGG